MGPTSDIERFARLRATMETRQTRDEVLAEEGLTVPQWIAIQRRWLRELAKEAGRGRQRLAKQYAAAFTLAAPSLAPAADPVAPAADPVAPQAPEQVVTLEPRFVLPSTPIVKARRPAVTTSMPAFDPTQGPRFTGNVAAPRSVADEVAAEAAGMIGETAQGVPALTDEQLAEPPAFTSARGPQSSTSLDTTAEVRNLELDSQPPDALPFAPQSSAAPSASDGPVSAAPLPVHDLGGETAFVSALTDEDLGDALPFEERSAPPPSSTALTLEQYTSLVVDINLRPGERSQTLMRYSLDEPGFVALKTKWNRTFSEDPAQYGMFRSLYDQYGAWMASRR
jgi:hypothetical protein